MALGGGIAASDRRYRTAASRATEGEGGVVLPGSTAEGKAG
jgi:hypothetical protein